MGWPFLFLTLAVQETEKDYNYIFGSRLNMNNEEPPAIDLWCVYIKYKKFMCFCVGLTLSCMQIGSTVHSDIPPKQLTYNEDWVPEEVKKHVISSVVGSKNLADEALKRYGADWPGLVAMISDIRTVCPLLYLSRSQQGKVIPFYLVNHTRENPSTGSEELADVAVDVEAILGLYDAQTSSARRYVL